MCRASGARGPAVAIALAALAALTGCANMPTSLSTDPKLGGSGTVATGAAGGANAENASSQLERCPETLGTLAIEEDQQAPWYLVLTNQYKLPSTTPMLRMIVQQSNCFVVVERGRSMGSLERERQIARGGEARSGNNFQPGQMVTADYTMQPTINFSGQSATGGVGVGVGGWIGAIAGVASTFRTNEASTNLLLIDNRSSVQISASEGYAKNTDFGLAGALFAGGGGGGAGAVGGAYGRTNEGKIIVAAFMDSYNQMVRALRNYQAQRVRGGLGTGGRLGVQGGQTEASREIGGAAATPATPATTRPAATTSPTPATPAKPTSSSAPAPRAPTSSTEGKKPPTK